jgi:hypothetical protein
MELLEARAETRFRLAKVSSTEPLFAIQVLVWAASPVRARAVEHVHALVACFGQFADQNHLRAVGWNLGFVHLGGSDSIWRRWRFDERARSGLFRPAKEAYVTACEIAGFLKPPTKHCRTANVVRSGGVTPNGATWGWWMVRQDLVSSAERRSTLPLVTNPTGPVSCAGSRSRATR